MNVELLTFVLPANGTARIERAGGYLEVIQADFNIASISLDGPDGNAAAFLRNVLSGIYARSKFRAISIVNGAAAQTVVLMVADAEAGSNRQPGTVEVVDGGKARTLAGQAGFAPAVQAATAAKSPYGSVWNPAGSGLRVIIKQLIVSSPTAGGEVRFGYILAQPVSMTQNAVRKLTNGTFLNAQVRVDYFEDNSFIVMGRTSVPAANTPQTIVLSEPVIVTEGRGFCAGLMVVNTAFHATFEIVEEPL